MTLQLPNEIQWKLKDCAIVIHGDDHIKVQIIKDEDGEYNQEMFIGFRSTDGQAVMKLCYYVKQLDTGICYWEHAEYMYLPERSRPYYGLQRTKPSEANARKVKATKKKRQDHKEHVLPINAKNTQNGNSDLNTTYDQNHIAKLQNDNNELKKFELRGKDMMFDMLVENLNNNDVGKDIDMQSLNCDGVTTEDKIDILMGECLSKSEMDNYIYQCWRYNNIAKMVSVESSTSSLECPLANNSNVHITWCLVCGKRDNLQKCSICAASFHENCRQQWKATIMHRKMAPHVVNDKLNNVKKLSSTRTINYHKDVVHSNCCPSCDWGPAIGYGDVVWYKMKKCPWWPAKVIVPGLLPSCLLPMKHDVLPLRFYGTHNHAWCEPSRMCLFLTNHTVFLDEDIEHDLRDAIMEAFDDYICVYLT